MYNTDLQNVYYHNDNHPICYAIETWGIAGLKGVEHNLSMKFSRLHEQGFFKAEIEIL